MSAVAPIGRALSLFSVSTNPVHEHKPPGALRQRRSLCVFLFVWSVHSIFTGFREKRALDQNKAACLFGVTKKQLCMIKVIVLS